MLKRKRFFFLVTSVIILGLLILSPATFAEERIAKKKKPGVGKKFKPVAIPTVSANRSRGVGLGVIAMGFFKVKDTEETPPSRVGLGGNYTTHDNYNLIAFEQIFFKDDHWRMTSAQLLANSNFQTYLSGPEIDSTIVVPYNNYFRFFYVNVEKEIASKFYIGPQLTYGKADTKFDLSKTADRVDTQELNSWGLTMSHDTTKNKFNSDSGHNIRLLWFEYPEWMNNNQPFGSFNLQANMYHRLSDNKVLATRATGYYAYGTVPFVGQRFVGNNDIRGYTTGQYRGEEIYTAQTELRWNFYSRWGSVLFGGLAMAKDKEQWSRVLPGVGTGLRYQLLPEEGINAGLDYAVGNADWGVYFRITEAF